MSEPSDLPNQNDEQAQHIASLIARYLQEKINQKEYDELNDWVGSSETNMETFKELRKPDKLKEFEGWLSNELNVDQKLREIKSHVSFSRSAPQPLFSKVWHYAAAACLIGIITVAAFFIFRNNASERNIASKEHLQDLQPGSTDKAILTLDDGSLIMLNDARDGRLAAQGNSDITKQQGQLQYKIAGRQTETGLLYNTVTTPRGGSYTLTLSDGSRIWLNAGSSIRFPVMFGDMERKVLITGEVYFEVASANTAKGTRKPFIVEVKDKGIAVEVLGTHFNINSYEDEPAVKTTLLEGAVKVATGGKTSFLKPGQQAQVNETGEIKTASNIDPEVVMAWKRNMFHFSDTDLKTIMKQISRWYDVNIQFETSTNPRYSALLLRDLPASKIFETLEESGGVHFKIEGKTVKVLP